MRFCGHETINVFGNFIRPHRPVLLCLYRSRYQSSWQSETEGAGVDEKGLQGVRDETTSAELKSPATFHREAVQNRFAGLLFAEAVHVTAN